VTPAAAEDDLLRLDGIGVRLGGRLILRDVCSAVRPGEFTGPIGPDGAGKTTLLRVILDLLAPTSGRVLLNGRPRPRRAGSLIGNVPQKIIIDPDMPLHAHDVAGPGPGRAQAGASAAVPDQTGPGHRGAGGRGGAAPGAAAHLAEP
jgi:ABC-type Mn2+/Zn2+ transport system ATPase subunit